MSLETSLLFLPCFPELLFHKLWKVHDKGQNHAALCLTHPVGISILHVRVLDSCSRFQFSANTNPGSQQVTVTGALPPMWEILMEFKAPDFSSAQPWLPPMWEIQFQAQPQLLWASGGWASRWEISVTLSVCLSLYSFSLYASLHFKISIFKTLSLSSKKNYENIEWTI